MNLRSTMALVLPSLLFIAVFMVLPLLIALVYSFMTADTYGGVTPPASWAAYRQLVYTEDFDGSLAFDPAYLIIILRSVGLAAATTVCCLIVGLPIAWYIVCQDENRRRLFLFLVTLPFWVNTLIRTYCWVLILRDQGLLNDFLRHIGLIAAPLPLLYNDGAILLGLVYTFVPFMVLPIYAVLERLDTRLIEAAHDLYAGRAQVFRLIVWPLARPGVIAGSILIFAPALGAFLAPDMLGGGKKLMIGSLIQMQFTASRNWPFGAALAVLVTVAVLLALGIAGRRGKLAEFRG